MDDDPIETDDPIDAALWHAEEKIAMFTAHVKATQERLRTLTHICSQWRLHAETLRHARFKRPRDSVEANNVPTQPSTGPVLLSRVGWVDGGGVHEPSASIRRRRE